ncbi:hypothetical protein FRB97_001751 [Tulasnella sp. 331]|nr:hypothetical protein FRB97_001751 [Tulasnella sp. 331]
MTYGVLLDIFWSLEEEQFYGTLQSTGLVCRAWYNPAMDVLWSNIGLLRLLNVLSPLEKEGRHWRRFMQPLTPYRWSRFHSLAYRVKDARMHGYSFDPVMMLELSRANPKPGPLLPNIRRLFFREERIEHSPTRMCPTVESLNLFLETNRSQGRGGAGRGGADNAQTISNFFTQMGVLCPNLTDLRLGGQGIGADSRAVAAQTIGQLHHLKTVHLSSYDDDDVTVILLKMAELPALKSLSLADLEHFPSRSGAAAFLHILASTGSHLTELKLGEEYGSGTPDLMRIVSMAGEHKGLKTLMMYSRHDKTPLIINTLQPIFECHSLTTLKLKHGADVSMTNDDFETLASSLTKLKNLALTSCWDEHSPSLTLRALSIAVALLPCLERLTLAIDAREPVPPEQQVHVAPHQRFQELRVGSSPVSRKVDDVVGFISGLSDVEGFQIESHGESASLWDMVNGALPEMRTKRVTQMGA